jgi:2-keto-4-pentenoate hydratase
VYRVEEPRELRVDAELAIEIGADGQPARYGAALELVDVAKPPEDFESIVSGNVWHRAFALSPLRSEAPPESVRAEVRINGEVVDAAEGRVDPVETVRIASELLAAVGERLEPGDRIIAGSMVHVPVAPGDEVVVELAELGEVGVRLR